MANNRIDFEMNIDEALQLIQDLSKMIVMAKSNTNSYGCSSYGIGMVDNINSESELANPSRMTIRVVN